MLAFLSIFLIAAFIAPVLVKIGRLGFLILSLVPAGAFVYLVSLYPRIYQNFTYLSHGTESTYSAIFPYENFPWAPALGLELSFRLDYLSWLMGLIVTGVGTLVLCYCARYFSASAQGLGRFAAVFLSFSAAMLGLVTTDNTLALYLFWELTTVFSFLLIGHSYEKSAARRAALQAIIVTTTGGLAMLAGLIILGQIPGGSYSISELIAAAQSGQLGVAPIVANSTPLSVLNTAVVLILLGAFSKSALIPFHFWLPAAMAAPTPVSAYLHAAAMVKAGIYLVARFAPAFADYMLWQQAILFFGISTMLLGGYRALRQKDLKLILAFGTVSQLGLLMLLVGYGTAETMLAGLALLCAHALFKSALFLTVGYIDWATGTRDIRELSGLGRQLPLLAFSAFLATASMIGLPPLVGYVAKEAALHALLEMAHIPAVIKLAVIVGAIFTTAYSIRFYWGAFARKPKVGALSIKPKSYLMLAPILLLSLSGLILGLLHQKLEFLLTPSALNLGELAGHLTLWSGVTLAFLATLLILGAGILLFCFRVPLTYLADKIEFPWRADAIYQHIIQGLDKLSGAVTGFTQRGSLPAYLSIIFSFTLITGMTALILGDLNTFTPVRLYDSLGQLAAVILIIGAALAGARARHRLKAVLLIGVSGYGVALIYELYGAPDLALTQVLAETMTLVVFVLVLRRLPAYFSNRPIKLIRWLRILLAIIVGACAAIITWFAAAARMAVPVSSVFHDEAYYYGYGANIVNVTLVDIRAWDTFGEISVVVAAAIGVSSLLFIRNKTGRIDRFRNLSVPSNTFIRQQFPTITEREEKTSINRNWLVASHTVSIEHRSIILEVGTRFVFHTMVIISLYFLFAGHNFPGGGFAGGIMAGVALVLRYLAGGRYELGATVPLNPGHLLGSGLVLAASAALIPLLFGGTTLQTAKFELFLPVFGPVKIATALLFDIGVYLIVIGLVLDILRSLGAEIDRHGELDGVDNPDTWQIVPQLDTRRENQEALDAKDRHIRDIATETSVDLAEKFLAETNAKERNKH